MYVLYLCVSTSVCDRTMSSPPSPLSPPLLSAVEVETIDPYDLLDPVDLLAQMPKDFYDNIVRSRSESSLHLWIDVLLLLLLLLFWFRFCTF